MRRGRFSASNLKFSASDPNLVSREKTCHLCTKDSESGSCLFRYHAAAEENLRDAYKKWKSAYGEMMWKIYLEQVIQLPSTGIWVKDVAQHELKV